MFRSSAVLAVARWSPEITRLALRLATCAGAPRQLREHWLIADLQRDLWPDGGEPVLVESLRLFVPGHHRGSYENYEPLTRKALEATLRPGMVVIDVGAHIGYFTVMAARAVGDTGHVWALEPYAENVAVLRRNVRHNGLRNVTIRRCAAGAMRRRRTFHVTGSPDMNGFYPHPLSAPVRTLEVDEIPIDEVVDGIVHLIKIDVEGAELEVLNGMTETLRRARDAVLCVEWNPKCLRRAGYDPRELPDRIAALGFPRMEVIDESAGRRVSVDEMQARIGAGSEPATWVGNLWATRA